MTENEGLCVIFGPYNKLQKKMTCISERKVTESHYTSARLNCDGFVTNEDKESRCVSGLSGLRDKERTLRDIDRLKNCLFIQNKKTTPT